MILCCGEALIDMLPRRTVEGQPAFLPVPGGAVFNTAIALGRLGTPTGFFSGLSTDPFGERLCRSLRESGVDYAMAKRSGRPTTLAFVTLEDGQARYSFYDENTAGRMLEKNALPDLERVSVDALFFGGISLINEPAASAYEAFMMAHAHRVPVMLDPNIRAGFIGDEGAYRTRIERMIAAATIVKLSDEDLAWLTGQNDARRGARSLIGSGPSLIVVTRGADGALALTATAEAALPSRRVEVVDTVGAGDTFNAGLLCALHEMGRLSRLAIASLTENEIGQCLQLAIDAAAVTVSRAGANPPWRNELPV